MYKYVNDVKLFKCETVKPMAYDVEAICYSCFFALRPLGYRTIQIKKLVLKHPQNSR